MNAMMSANGLKRVGALACAAACALWAPTCRAQDYQPHAGNLVVRVGAAGVLFNSSGKINLGGQPLPDAGLKLTDNATAAFTAEYFVRPDISVSLNVGAPPTTTANGLGVLAPLGKLGSVEYGPAAALVNYHFSGLGRFQPWVGVGATRMVVFSHADAAITKLHVDPSWGGAFQGGAEYMLNSHWGAYGSVTRLLLRSHGTGAFEGLPVMAKIGMDSTVVQGGLSYRF